MQLYDQTVRNMTAMRFLTVSISYSFIVMLVIRKWMDLYVSVLIDDKGNNSADK